MYLPDIVFAHLVSSALSAVDGKAESCLLFIDFDKSCPGP